MKRPLLTLLSLAFLLTGAYSQKIFITRAGIASFLSNAPLEIIKASSDLMEGAINLADGSFVFTIDNKTFKGFNSSLQQEHFYENYMEVQKYPFSSFKGMIIEVIETESREEQVVRAKGTLDIHGRQQERIIKGTLRINGDKVIVHADFTVPLEDHNIKIPRIVYQKIAEIIEVSISAEMTMKTD